MYIYTPNIYIYIYIYICVYVFKENNWIEGFEDNETFFI